MGGKPVVRVVITKGKTEWAVAVEAMYGFTDDDDLVSLLEKLLPGHGYTVKIKKLPMHDDTE